MSQFAPEIEALIDSALAEDLSTGDLTTETLIPSDLAGRAQVVSRVGGVLAGIDVTLAVFKRVDPTLETKALIEDGATLEPGSLIAEVEGPVASILKAERTALNFLQRLSGIATETGRYVKAVSGYTVKITDTRKTTPGIRTLEKCAIRAGGGINHRRSLGDGILIKDNHIQALRVAGLSLKEVVEKARANASDTTKVEVEVEDLEQVRAALDGEADILLLDNMKPGMMAEAVKLAQGRAVTEASGGISLETVRDVAATGVDLISVGALTHSVKALDVTLELE